MADIFGVEITDPPTGWTVLETVVVCKALNENGNVTMFIRASEGLVLFEELGLLTAALRSVADDIQLCDDDDPDFPDDDG